MKRTISALLALILTACASTHRPKLHGDLFSELAPGARIHIRFGSMGCFHHYGYDFDFERGAATTVRITSLQRSRLPLPCGLRKQIKLTIHSTSNSCPLNRDRLMELGNEET